MDPFETLGVEPRFDLNLDDLASRQRELSRALHPDRFVQRPASERRAALGRAIEVNEAYRLVKKPIPRAEALLSVTGISLPENQQPPAPAELLMEMMEKRQDLKDAGRSSDVARIEALKKELKVEEQKVLEELAEAFRAVLSRTNFERSAEATPIYSALSILRYYRRFFDEADALLDELL